jgi:RNA polymerase sigma factor (sigma-70 family)
MRDDPAVIALVGRAAAGDEGAWNEIIERYAPLVWSICARYKLGQEEIHDVGQTVWLRLIEKIGSLREPAALPGWLAVTAQRECFRVLRVERRHAHAELPTEDQLPSDPDAAMIEEEVLAAERAAAIRAALATLPSSCRALLSMLASDPPPGYTEISGALGVAAGTVGPMRARCLDRIRRSPQMASFAGRTVGDTGERRTRSRGR